MQKSELMFWEECETAEQDDEGCVLSRGIPLTPLRLDASQRTSSDASTVDALSAIAGVYPTSELHYSLQKLCGPID